MTRRSAPQRCWGRWGDVRCDKKEGHHGKHEAMELPGDFDVFDFPVIHEWDNSEFGNHRSCRTDWPEDT